MDIRPKLGGAVKLRFHFAQKGESHVFLNYFTNYIIFMISLHWTIEEDWYMPIERLYYFCVNSVFFATTNIPTSLSLTFFITFLHEKKMANRLGP